MLKKAALWGISKGVRLPQQFDRIDELARLKQLLEVLQPDYVLDVGANRGQFAQDVRGIGYDGHIISFEPLVAEFDAMRRAFTSDRRWTGFNFALGEQRQDTVINIPNKSVNASLLETVSGERVRQEPMTIRRLDELGLSFERAFLKMDTQGFDLKAFAGGAGVLEQIVGLQSELSVVPLYKNMPHYMTALGTYESAGFKLFDLAPVSRMSNGGLQEMNCLMRR